MSKLLPYSSYLLVLLGLGLCPAFSVTAAALLPTVHLNTTHEVDAGLALPLAGIYGSFSLWSSGLNANGSTKFYVGQSSRLCAGNVDQISIVQHDVGAAFSSLRHMDVCLLVGIPSIWALQQVKSLAENDAVVVTWVNNNILFGEIDGAIAVYSASTGALRWSQIGGGMVPLTVTDGIIVVSHFLLGSWIAAIEVGSSSAPMETVVTRWNTSAPPGIILSVDKAISTDDMIVLLGNTVNTTRSGRAAATGGGGESNSAEAYQFSMNSTDGSIMCVFNATNYLGDQLRAGGFLAIRKPLNGFHEELWDMSPRCRVVATCFSGDGDFALLSTADSWYRIKVENGNVTRLNNQDGSPIWTSTLGISISTFPDLPSLGESSDGTKLQYFAQFVLYTFDKSTGALLETASDPSAWPAGGEGSINDLHNILPYSPASVISPRTMFHFGSHGEGSSDDVFFVQNLQGFTVFNMVSNGTSGPPNYTPNMLLTPFGWNVQKPLLILDSCGPTCVVLLDGQTGAISTALASW